jgi:hypothetical protein
MYQWWIAQEQADLWKEENRPLTSAERQRIEFLEEMEEAKPSLFRRIATLFKGEPEPDIDEPFIPHTREEAELVLAGRLNDQRN